MIRLDNYSARLLDAAMTVCVLNESRGLYQCQGFVAHISEGYPARCECSGFKAEGECIHLDAIGFVLDHGPMQG